MIIDMLAHIGVKKGEDYHVESLIEIMNQSGVDKCMICSQLETVNNDYIYESVQKFPERTFGFAVVNPWDINGEEQLEKCFRDYHFYGLKMNAIRFGYSADRHSLLSPYFELCRAYGKCVVVHGQSDMFSIPDKWAQMARSFPDVPVVLYHMGVPLMYERAMELAKEIPNFYLSTAGAYVPVIQMAYEKVGPEKILFSSDAPFCDQKQEMDKIRYVTKNEGHLELMLGKNSARIMNMDGK